MDSPAQEIENPNFLLKQPHIRTVDAMESDGAAPDSEDSMYMSDEEDTNREKNIRLAASRLLHRKEPPVIRVLYKDLKLHMFRNEVEDPSGDPVLFIFDDSSVLNENGQVFFKSFRSKLNKLVPSARLDSNEICLKIPSLAITLNEDNSFNHLMSFGDIVTLFEKFQRNSKASQSQVQHNCLVFEVELKPRFFIRYNELVEAMDNSGTFDQVLKFSNDESHPVVLEDDDEEVKESDLEVISD